MTDKFPEKLFTWSPEKRRWYADACEFEGNDRNKKLAAFVLDKLPTHPHVCDVGCGIGALSLELASAADKVTAIDVNSNALEFLRDRVLKRKIENINIVEGDFPELQPPCPKADGLVLCMVGGGGFIETAKKWTDGKVVLISDNTRKRSFSTKPKNHDRPNVDSVLDTIKNAGYSAEQTVVEASFGQPFRTYEDAVSFMGCYNRSSSSDEIRDLLESKLVDTGMKDFPLYLPSRKEYLVLTINM